MLLTEKKTSKNIIASYNRDNNILFISLYSSSSGIELNSKRVRWNFFLSRVLFLSFFFFGCRYSVAQMIFIVVAV